MRGEWFECDVAQLPQQLVSESILSQYNDYLLAELPQVADASLLKQLKRHQKTLGTLQGYGIDVMKENDPAAIDALLTDIFAVASYFGWKIGCVAQGEKDIPLDVDRRGLLGADDNPENMLLWIIDEKHVALCRDREADDEADMTEHWRHEGKIP